MRINNNIMALNAYRNLYSTGEGLGKSLEKLSSGLRINRAADDAAGLVISEGLRAQIGGLNQAKRNTQDGISVVQTAEGALNEVENMMRRMRDLSVQAANSGSNDAVARQAAQDEISQLTSEIDRIATTTKFGNQTLLDGSFGVKGPDLKGYSINASGGITTNTAEFTLRVNTGATATGASASFTVSLTSATYTTATSLQTALQSAVDAGLTVGLTGNVTAVVNDAGNGSWQVELRQVSTDSASTMRITGSNATASLGLDAQSANSTGSGGVFQVGANVTATEQISVSITDFRVSSGSDVNFTALKTLDVVNNAATAQQALDAAIAALSSQRGKLGAVQNRFESTIASLQVTSENLTASESRIRDADMAQEMVKFTKFQILNQAGTAMLAQANQLPQGILSLLKG